MALSKFDTLPLLSTSDTTRYRRPTLCAAKDDALWTQFIGALDADSDFAYLADIARKWRTAGMPLETFLKEMIASFEACELNDRLEEVFDFSERDGWDIGPDGIEAAFDRFKDGASAAEAYEYAKRIAGRTDGSKPH